MDESHQPLSALIFFKSIQKNLAIFPALNTLLEILSGNHFFTDLSTKHSFIYFGMSSFLGCHKAFSVIKEK